jgi:hypothetical protein
MYSILYWNQHLILDLEMEFGNAGIYPHKQEFW